MEKKSSTWTTIFWVVTILCILQYVFMTIPRISSNPNNANGAYILGSLLPNALIIFIFWLIKRKAEK